MEPQQQFRNLTPADLEPGNEWWKKDLKLLRYCHKSINALYDFGLGQYPISVRIGTKNLSESVKRDDYDITILIEPTVVKYWKLDGGITIFWREMSDGSSQRTDDGGKTWVSCSFKRERLIAANGFECDSTGKRLVKEPQTVPWNCKADVKLDAWYRRSGTSDWFRLAGVSDPGIRFADEWFFWNEMPILEYTLNPTADKPEIFKCEKVQPSNCDCEARP